MYCVCMCGMLGRVEDKNPGAGCSSHGIKGRELLKSLPRDTKFLQNCLELNLSL